MVRFAGGVTVFPSGVASTDERVFRVCDTGVIGFVAGEVDFAVASEVDFAVVGVVDFVDAGVAGMAGFVAGVTGFVAGVTGFGAGMAGFEAGVAGFEADGILPSSECRKEHELIFG